MNISKVQNLSFKRALRESEIEDYKKTLKEGREAIGADGKNILIVPDTSLPTSNKSIIGNLSDEKALEFADFMKTYLGINAIEYLPQGDFQEDSHDFNPYDSTTLTYPKHLINLESFTKKEFGELLKPDEIKTNNKFEGTGRSEIPFKEVYEENSDFNKTLKVAYSRFNKTNPLWQEYLDYRKENDENIIPRVLFLNLVKEHGEYRTANWPEPDSTLFKDVDETKKNRLEELKTKYKDQIDFYAFEQFFAHKNLKYSKEKLNKMGLELVGDCPIRFSEDEMWANPDACSKDIFIGKPSWKINALDFQNMFDKNGEPLPSMQLLGKKFKKTLRDYDSVRIDCGWCYIQPSLYDGKTQEKKYINTEKNKFGDTIVNYFEKLAKEVKGEDYDLSKIMYEVEVGGGDDFYAVDRKKGVIEPLENRTQIFTTVHTDLDPDTKWGTMQAYTLLGVNRNDMLLGTGNHDYAPLRDLQKGEEQLTDREIEKLNKHFYRYFNYRENFDNKEDLAKGKRAEVALAKNQMHFFYDVFGWKLNDKEKNKELTRAYYGTKINENYKDEYLNSLKDGTGYNPMESLKIAFMNNIYDTHRKENSELYNKIVKYSEILKAEEGEMLEEPASTAPATDPIKNGENETNVTPKTDEQPTKTEGAGETGKTENKNTEQEKDKPENGTTKEKEKIKNENKFSPYVIVGTIVAGLMAAGAFIHSKFKKKPEKKEKV